MAKQNRKHLTFQTGEISPSFFGRSDDEIYQKGLAIADNVWIDKRGGAFKRGGLEHIGRITGNNARVFTIQATRTRYYTIVIHDLEMIVIAPGAGILGNNLLLNGNFGAAGANWTSLLAPSSSQVQFQSGEALLLPEQNNPDRVINGSFNQGGTGWITRESSPQSTVTFATGSVTLEPRLGGGGSAEYAGVAQQITTGLTTNTHDLVINADFLGSSLHVMVGTAEADGTYLDTIIDVNSPPLTFTPAAVPYFITVDCEKPDPIVQVFSIAATERIVKTAAVTQQATVVDLITDTHLVIVSQAGRDRITIKIGTASGLNDILEVITTDIQTNATFVPNAATYWVTVEADGDNETQARISFVGTAKDTATIGLGILMPAPWTEAQLNEIHMVESPEGKAFYFTHPNVPIQKLIYDHATDTFVNLTEVAFVNPIPEWSGTSHPSTGTFYQGRMWFGGTPNERQTFWGSVSGDYENFAKDDGGGPPVITDSNAVEFTLREFGRIEWMLGTKTLLIGTEFGEHLVTSDGPVITPSDFRIEQQSSYGSNNMQGTQVAEKVFYLTPDGRKLRAMSYEWQEDNWISLDLTYASEHITEGVGIHSAWAQHPDNLFAVVLADGTIAVLTYDRSAKTVAWTRLNAVGFKALDIATGRNIGRNETIIVGQRTPGFIDLEANSSVKQYLDSYVSKFYPFGGTLVDGLDHLEGLQVRPLVDGAVDPLQTVVGGQINTDTAGNQIFVGRDYTATIKTLPMDTQGQIRSFKKRWNKVWALMLDSKAPIINGARPPDRTPSTPMGIVEPDISDHYKTVNLGLDDFGQITISQDLPVAMNILAIYGEMDAESIG